MPNPFWLDLEENEGINYANVFVPSMSFGDGRGGEGSWISLANDILSDPISYPISVKINVLYGVTRNLTVFILLMLILSFFSQLFWPYLLLLFYTSVSFIDRRSVLRRRGEISLTLTTRKWHIAIFQVKKLHRKDFLSNIVAFKVFGITVGKQGWRSGELSPSTNVHVSQVGFSDSAS